MNQVAQVKPQIKTIDPPTEHIPEIVTEFLASRGIPVHIANQFPLVGGEKYFAEAGKHRAIGFVYGDPKQPEAIKWRSTGDKEFTQQGAARSFFGVNQLPEGITDLIICEGEMDVLALASAGIQAVSVPNGAPAKVTDGRVDPKQDGKFSYVWDARELLDSVNRVIFFPDQDAPGQALVEELARRIGRAKCWTVTLPEKDANETLIKHGPQALQEALQAAKPLPLEGVYLAEDFATQIVSLYESGVVKGASTGMSTLDPFYTVLPGQLSVVTGLPGSGKLELIDQICVNIAMQKGWRFAVASFENPPHMHLAKLAEKVVGKPFFDNPDQEKMTEAERDYALNFLNEHFVFLQSHDGAPSTVQSIIDRTKQAVMRMGVRGLIIDPYNYLDMGGDNEHQAIGKMLTDIVLFCKGHDIHAFFVAHPAKAMPDDGIPKGQHISGCYSDDTEVLTKRGWIPHPEVNEQDTVACFNPGTEELEWHPPQQVHEYEYDGVMHHWQGAALDLLVTPNHRMVVKPAYQLREKKGSPITGRPPTWEKDAWQFVNSESISGTRWSIPMRAIPAENKTASSPIESIPDSKANDLAWFIGFWLAEGHVSMGALQVCQAVGGEGPPRSVMHSLGLHFKERHFEGRPGEKMMWTARLYKRSHKELCEFVQQECGEGAPNKKLPSYIFDASIEEKMSMLDGFCYGDGNISGSNARLTTTSKELADGLQRLAIECGWWAHIYKTDRKHLKCLDCYTVTVRPHDSRTVEVRRNRSDIQYSGKVYCLTVPTGAYITRRKGRMVVCGNSAAWFAKADMGLTVHRRGGDTEVHVWKARFKWVGKIGSVGLNYDLPTGRYSDKQDAVTVDYDWPEF